MKGIAAKGQSREDIRAWGQKLRSQTRSKGTEKGGISDAAGALFCPVFRRRHGGLAECVLQAQNPKLSTQGSGAQPDEPADLRQGAGCSHSTHANASHGGWGGDSALGCFRTSQVTFNFGNTPRLLLGGKGQCFTRT
uniref:Uncharacterized protein n=1 Tax=Coccidioides posadasii RMSCC 3488 TaxID=454284 RepID=A0A0J6FEU4_COCPO|nr:hypothetical protein CPAG_05167 [Coccidioides posadasii RMSCC 3488]